jgi:hypothetical protein
VHAFLGNLTVVLSAWLSTRRLLLAALLLTATSCWAAAVTIPDPKGDDFGAGGVLYPNRPDMKPGDLDLTELSFESRADGTWFAVRFAQPIRGPGSEVTATGQVPIANIARLGFYTFNVDIYIDTDRVAGSGFTDSIPGRGVAIDRAFAWERVIVLTPRPDIARALLETELARVAENELIARQGRAGKAEVARIEATARSDVARRYWFPTRVRVLGREVQFYVPASFLGRAADARMGYTVIVTGAELDQVGRSSSGGRNRAVMMVMPLVRGMRENAFGLRSDDDAASPPVIDVLAPTIEAQRAALQNFDVVAGRLATVPGIAPDGSVAAPPAPSVASKAAEATAAQPDRAARVGDAGRSSAPSTGGRRTVPERLRELNQLRTEGLISEQEYLDLRRKILAEL